MGNLKISGLIEDGEVDKVQKLDSELLGLLQTYKTVATELAKGIKMEIDTPKDLERLYTLYNTQASIANKTTIELNATLDKQKRVLQDVADSLQKKVAGEDLSAKEMKILADASTKNAAALEKVAKAELAATKAQNAGNTARKNVKMSDEERIKVIKDATSMLNKEAHSISEAKEQNKLLRIAVSQVTDAEDKDNKIRQQLNNQITKNTEYIRFNSDAYTKQKMAIGSYKNEIKAAVVELRNGNNTFKNLGVVAKGFGGILKSEVTGGLKEVGLGVGSMIKGFVGAQAIMTGIQRLIGLFKQGIQAAIDFEAANSKLASILGTTSNKIKDLTTDAQRLGATTKYTASQATALQIELAKLGFSRNEILQSTEYVLKFAQATGAELPEAAALAGAALRMFNADTTETERYVSAMAVATTKSALSFSYLQTAMPIVGPVAKAFNFQIEDTLALLGKLADAGFDASMSATATRNILLNLADGNGKLAKALGGPVKTLPELIAGLQKLKEQGIDLNSTLELTDKRSVAAFNAFLTAADKIVPLREQITGVDKELGDMADTMNDNVQGSIYGLSSAWEAFMLSIVKSKGTIKEVIDNIAEWLRNLAFEGMSGEEDVLGMETKLQKDAQALSKGDIEKARKEFNARMNSLRNEGLSEEEAYNKAAEELSNKRINISVKEQRDVEFLRKRAIINDQNWKDSMEKGWGYINNKFANFFHYSTSEAKKADKALTDYARGYTEYMKSISFNAGIDIILSDFKPINENSSYTNPKTEEELEKERRAAEAAAKERLRIQQELEQSKLDLMEEGLQKELDKIAFNYNKRIAAIKGNSEAEQKTRENLAQKMQQDMDNFEVDYYLQKEQEKIKNKLSVVKKGSDEEYDLRLRLLNLEEEKEREAAIRKNESLVAIDEKYSHLREELEEKHASDKNTNLEEEYAARLVLVNAAMAKELDEVAEQYKKGEINAEEHEKKKANITKKYMIQQLKSALELAKMMYDMPGLSDEDRLKMKQKIAEAEIALSNAVREAEVNDAKEAGEERKKELDEFKDSLYYMNDIARDALGDTAGIFEGLSRLIESFVDGGKLSFQDLATALIDVLNGINGIAQNSLNMRIDKIEEEHDANDEAYDKDIERIERLAEEGAISEEEAEARKRAAKEKTEAKNAELEKKKQALLQKQAKWDKATSIAQAGIATALAITKALPNLILAAIVGAMGAVQVATITATPIPSYAEGTKDGFHPGGKALVGDAGKREVVMFNGLAWITPDTPMLVDLPRGAKVFPDVDDTSFPEWSAQVFGMPFAERGFISMHQDAAKTTVINDFSALERKMDENNKLLAISIKQRRQDAYNLEFELYKLKRI